ncbi:wee1-like protein kinase [Chaetoceros tenuissimus]|uniref:Wee1-like protein kinase n=1 Tax=Chaetoceros tenuissimus TaxID=426638 RepID=A0AAD3CHU0_9STRA|nr:wee1-like protein kinase [Chaetoceros tenuissimus]
MSDKSTLHPFSNTRDSSTSIDETSCQARTRGTSSETQSNDSKIDSTGREERTPCHGDNMEEDMNSSFLTNIEENNFDDSFDSMNSAGTNIMSNSCTKTPSTSTMSTPPSTRTKGSASSSSFASETPMKLRPLEAQPVHDQDEYIYKSLSYYNGTTRKRASIDQALLDCDIMEPPAKEKATSSDTKVHVHNSPFRPSLSTIPSFDNDESMDLAANDDVFASTSGRYSSPIKAFNLESVSRDTEASSRVEGPYKTSQRRSFSHMANDHKASMDFGGVEDDDDEMHACSKFRKLNLNDDFSSNFQQRKPVFHSTKDSFKNKNVKQSLFSQQKFETIDTSNADRLTNTGEMNISTNLFEAPKTIFKGRNRGMPDFISPTDITANTPFQKGTANARQSNILFTDSSTPDDVSLRMGNNFAATNVTTPIVKQTNVSDSTPFYNNFYPSTRKATGNNHPPETPIVKRKGPRSRFSPNTCSPQPPQLSRFAQDFKIVDTLGSGSFGNVYSCLSEIDGQMYAVKASKGKAKGSSDKKRMLQEVKALAELSDISDVAAFHIVRYHQAWMEEDNLGFSRLYIVTDLCERTLLDEMRDENAKLWTDFPRLYKLLREMLLALNLVHTKGKVHLDIKPDNIFIKDDKFKLGDFGLVIEERTAKTWEIEEGDCRYMCLDLLSGNTKDLSKCDIFSLGITLYEIVRNAPLPMDGQQWQDLRAGKIGTMIGVPLPLVEIITDMMNPNADERPTCAELLKRRQLLSEDEKRLIEEKNRAQIANAAWANFKRMSPPKGMLKRSNTCPR